MNEMMKSIYENWDKIAEQNPNWSDVEMKTQ